MASWLPLSLFLGYRGGSGDVLLEFSRHFSNFPSHDTLASCLDAVFLILIPSDFPFAYIMASSEFIKFFLIQKLLIANSI